MVGLALDIKQHQLNTISDKFQNPILCYSEVFTAWENREDPALFTWATIVKALESPIVEEKKLAKIVVDWLARQQIEKQIKLLLSLCWLLFASMIFIRKSHNYGKAAGRPSQLANLLIIMAFSYSATAPTSVLVLTISVLKCQYLVSEGMMCMFNCNYRLAEVSHAGCFCMTDQGLGS